MALLLIRNHEKRDSHFQLILLVIVAITSTIHGILDKIDFFVIFSFVADSMSQIHQLVIQCSIANDGYRLFFGKQKVNFAQNGGNDGIFGEGGNAFDIFVLQYCIFSIIYDLDSNGTEHKRANFFGTFLHCWNLDRKAFISMMAGVPEMMPQLMMLCTWYRWTCDQIYCEPVSIGIRMACFESSGRLDHSAKALPDRLNECPKTLWLISFT
jgi:hypothetical protein